MTQRNFMLLQGPSSFFMRSLIAALDEQGAAVARIDLCPGDVLYRLGCNGTALRYRGRLSHWQNWVHDKMAELGTTDLACLGDGRPYHAAAIRAAQELGIKVHIFEHGYLRPNLLLCEQGGMGGRSHFPKTKPELDALAARNPESNSVQLTDHRPYQSSFLNYALMDVGWNGANLFFAWCSFPFYRGYSAHTVPEEWAGWIWKALTHKKEQKLLAVAERQISTLSGPQFLLPLQLETDFQIRDHADESLAEMVERQITEFAAYAPKTANLIIKRHPLDNGLANWRKRIEKYASSANISDRVYYINGGDLEHMIATVRDTGGAVVTVNSTVGLTALLYNCPTRVTGRAIYGLDQLVDQRCATEFWPNPHAPDPDLLLQFTTLLEQLLHVPGAFDGSGREEGARNLAARMLAPTK